VALAMRDESWAIPEVQEVCASIMRGFRRPQAAGFLQGTIDTIRVVDQFSPGGVFLGTRPGYVVDFPRLSRVVARTTKGLFFKETERRLPDSYEAVGISPVLFRNDADQMKRFRAWI